MLSPDEASLLFYEDVAALFSLIEDQWKFFEHALVAKVRWLGWADELKSIRNRIAHTRRPHEDDVSRLEQILRNIEPGAKKSLAAYDEILTDEENQAGIAAWFSTEPTWKSIAQHARRQYGTAFRVELTRRPWAAPSSPLFVTEGILVHAKWSIRDG